MKTISKTSIIMAILLIVCSVDLKTNDLANTLKQDDSNNDTLKPQYSIASREILKWTDYFVYTNHRIKIRNPTNYQYFDSSIFHYNNYDVIVLTYPGEAAEGIYIRDLNKNVIFNLDKYIHQGSKWFCGVIGIKLIIDLGDSPGIRGLIIMNITNLNIILSTNYSGPLKFENGLLNFQCYTENDNNKLPPCPDYKTYFEDQIFNFQNDSIIRTGKYNCEYY